MRTIKLLSGRAAGHEPSQLAAIEAIGQRVSDGREPETLRIYRPAPTVSFAPRDVRAPGYPAARGAARAGAFATFERRSGGHAMAVHEQTIVVDWLIPDPSPRAHIHERFADTAALLADALDSLGVDARVGAVAGEFCSGRYSVNARGRTKLVGLSQRLHERAACVSAALIADGNDRVRGVLLPVYRALALPWNPQTVGSVAAEVGSVSVDQAEEAIVAAFARQHRLVPASPAPDATPSGRG